MDNEIKNEGSKIKNEGVDDGECRWSCKWK